MVQGRIVRKGDKSEYDFYIEIESKDFVNIMSAHKKKGASHYSINIGSVHSNISQRNIASIKPNFLGTNFSAYEIVKDDQVREELVHIMYQTNILGLSGPRKV